MRKSKRIVVLLYGGISAIIILLVFFIVSITSDNKNENIKPTFGLASASATAETPKPSQQIIYNPYEGVDFSAYNQYEANILSDREVDIENYVFKEILFSYETDIEEDTISGFIKVIEEQDRLFAVYSVIDKSSEGYVKDTSSLTENKNIKAIAIEKYTENANTLWDRVLSLRKPDGNISGITGNIIILSKADDSKEHKESVISGWYFGFEGLVSQPKKIPVVKSISIQYNNKIIIDAENYTRIEWVTESGNIAGYGEEIAPYATNSPQWNNPSSQIKKPSKYVRAVIIGEEGIIYTQAFGLK